MTRVFKVEDVMTAMTGKSQANPLRTIGFSSELLRLNLNDDQLWEFAKQAAKRLVAIIHPDHQNTEELQAGAAIRNAFEALKDKRAFLTALRELRNHQNEVHAAHNEKLRDATYKVKRMEELERKNSGLLNKQQQLSDELHYVRQALARVKDWRKDVMALTNPLPVMRKPLQQARMMHETGRVIGMRVFIRTGKPNRDPDAIHSFVGGFQKAYSEERHSGRTEEELREVALKGKKEFAKLGFGVASLNQLVKAVENHSIPILHWDMDRFLNSFGYSLAPEEGPNIPCPDDIARQSVFGSETFAQVYRDLFFGLTTFLAQKHDWVSEVYIYPEIIDLNGGAYEEYRVVGGAFLNEKMKVGKWHGKIHGMLKLGLYPDHAQYPFLCEGGLIAMVQPNNIFVPSGSLESRVKLINEKMSLPVASKDLVSSHLLIEFL